MMYSRFDFLYEFDRWIYLGTKKTYLDMRYSFEGHRREYQWLYWRVVDVSTFLCLPVYPIIV